jgi:hypothetical protein
MEITNALLVVIMFVILLSLGIGNVLTAIVTVVDRRTQLRIDWFHASWMVLLLLAALSLFWHSLTLLDIEEWQFKGFVYVVAGPILLFFASGLLLPSDAAATDLRTHYLAVSPQFFGALALLQLWVIGVDMVLGHGLTTGGMFNAAVAVIALVLATSKRTEVHAVGTALAWALYLTAATLRGLNVIT